MNFIYKDQKRDDEAAISYVARFAHHNGFKDEHQFLRKIDRFLRDPQSRGETTTESIRLGRATNWINGLFGRPRSNFRFDHKRWRRTPVELETARLCAQCWTKDQYFRIYWRFKNYERCHIHNQPLRPTNEPGYGNYRVAVRDQDHWGLYDSKLALPTIAFRMSRHGLALDDIPRLAERDAPLMKVLPFLEASVAMTGRIKDRTFLQRAIASGSFIEIPLGEPLTDSLIHLIERASGASRSLAIAFLYSWSKTHWQTARRSDRVVLTNDKYQDQISSDNEAFMKALQLVRFGAKSKACKDFCLYESRSSNYGADRSGESTAECANTTLDG